MKKRMIAALGIFVLFAAVLTAGETGTTSPTKDSKLKTTYTEKMERPANVVAAARSSSELSEFIKCVDKTPFAKTLEGKGPYTVFAPSNDAWAACADAERKQLSDSRILESTLKAHVIEGQALTLADLTAMNGQKLVTMQGEKLPIVVENRVVWVGSAKIVGTDVLTSNGVLYVVDDVMTPKPTFGSNMK